MHKKSTCPPAANHPTNPSSTQSPNPNPNPIVENQEPSHAAVHTITIPGQKDGLNKMADLMPPHPHPHPHAHACSPLLQRQAALGVGIWKTTNKLPAAAMLQHSPPLAQAPGCCYASALSSSRSPDDRET